MGGIYGWGQVGGGGSGDVKELCICGEEEGGDGGEEEDGLAGEYGYSEALPF